MEAVELNAKKKCVTPAVTTVSVGDMFVLVKPSSLEK